MDPRLGEYARLLIGRSIAAEPGWQVLVLTTTEARPLAEELSRELARRGAYALPRVSFGGVYPLDVAFIAAAPELATELAPLEQHVVDHVDGAVFVLAPEDPPADRDLSPDARRASRAQFSAYRARGRTGGTYREVRCDYPCAYFAREAGLPLREYEDVFYAACLRDWDEESRALQRVLDRFDRADEVRIVGEATDLRLGLAGRRGMIDDGHQNVPGGEVFFCPVENATEGTIRFDLPSGRVSGATLRFRAGEVVEATADAGEDALLDGLATDPGARRVGEFGIGCNEGITRHLRNVLFDEKMAGTVHLALGAGFAMIGGRNESALHWDLVKDMRAGGELWCDGELVQRDGRWVF